MKIWAIEEEAERLEKRFKGVNRAAFARDNKVPGGQAMVYQHINKLRPISLDAAVAYARGFDCALEEISPRLAMEAQQALSLGKEESRVQADATPEPKATLTVEQQQILSFMESIDPETRKAWLKVSASLAKLNQSVMIDAPKPQSAHGVIEETKSVESGTEQTGGEPHRRQRRPHFGVVNAKRRPKPQTKPIKRGDKK